MRFKYSKEIAAVAISVVALTCLGLYKCSSKSEENKSPEEMSRAAIEALAKKLRTYDEIRSFHEGRAAVKRDGVWGFIDPMGEEVISCDYNESSDFHYERAAVMKSDKWGYIDLNGNPIVPCKYESVSDCFQDGMAAYKQDGNWGYLNLDGQEILPNKYTMVDGFSDGLAWVYDNDEPSGEGNGLNKGIFVDKTGKQVIPGKFISASAFVNGLCTAMRLRRVLVGGRRTIATTYLINKDGKIIKEFNIYEHGSSDPIPDGDCHDGMIKADGKGFMDASGNIVIPCIYDKVYDFGEGLAAVVKDGKIGFVDKKGNVVVSFIYDKIDTYDYSSQTFHDGLMKVCKNDKWGFINKEGKEVVPIEYEDVKLFSQGLSAVKKDGQWGFVDENGKVVIPIIYEEVGMFSEEGYAPVKKNGKWGIIDKYGNCTLDVQSEDPARQETASESPSPQKETIHGELGIFELRGRVKSCKWKYPDYTTTYTFDDKGFWLTEDGQTLSARFPGGIDRDDYKRIKHGSVDGYGSVHYVYDERGFATQINWDGFRRELTYDADGNVIKEKQEIAPDMGDEESNGEVIKIKYTILERDEVGNWTKRIAKYEDGSCEYEETRTITYYE